MPHEVAQHDLEKRVPDHGPDDAVQLPRWGVGGSDAGERFRGSFGHREGGGWIVEIFFVVNLGRGDGEFVAAGKPEPAVVDAAEFAESGLFPEKAPFE